MDGIKEIGKETNDKGARGRDFLSSSPAFHRDKSLSLSLPLSLPLCSRFVVVIVDVDVAV